MSKLPKILLWVFIALSLVVMVLFAMDSDVNSYDAWTSVDWMLCWAIALAAIAGVCTLVAACIAFVSDASSNPKGAIKTVAVLVAFVLLLVLSWSLGGKPVNVFGMEPSVQDFKLTDMCIISAGLLLGVAGVSILGSYIAKMFNK